MSNSSENNAPSNTPPTFEASMQELESIVSKMEQGDLSLEEALSCFERGITLARSSQEQLKTAEQKIQILMQQHEDAPLETFDPPEQTV